MRRPVINIFYHMLRGGILPLCAGSHKYKNSWWKRKCITTPESRVDRRDTKQALIVFVVRNKVMQLRLSCFPKKKNYQSKWEIITRKMHRDAILHVSFWFVRKADERGKDQIKVLACLFLQLVAQEGKWVLLCMGEKWEITGDGSNRQRSYLPSVERFHCLMLTLEYLIALENTCNNNKNITVEETELWYHVIKRHS